MSIDLTHLAKPLTYSSSRHLQEHERSEQNIRLFWERYGPSARDCYAYCDDIPSYHQVVRSKVQSMAWDTITKALTSGPSTINMDEGSHKVILIGPDPTNREEHLPSIVTKAITALLYEKDTEEQWRNTHRLYRTLHADAKTRAGSGWLLEPPFHALCVRGVTFVLSRMEIRPGGRINDIFTNTTSDIQENLILPPQMRVVYHKMNLIERLDANHYYEPVHGSQPSFDSFVYDPIGRRFNAFQVTTTAKHDMILKGFNSLRDLALRLGLGPTTIRIVLVVPQGHTVVAPMSMTRDPSFEMWSLEVSEDQLWDENNIR